MDVFRLPGTIAIENEQALQALDDTGQRADQTSNQFNNAFDKIGTVALGIGKAVVAAGAALGGAWMHTAIMLLMKSAPMMMVTLKSILLCDL